MNQVLYLILGKMTLFHFRNWKKPIINKKKFMTCNADEPFSIFNAGYQKQEKSIYLSLFCNLKK